MPADWSRPLDVDRAADQRSAWEFELPLAELPRLAPDLALQEGSAACRVEFARERGRPVAEVEVRSEVPLRCQRCLRPVWIEIDVRSMVRLVTDPAQAGEAEPGEGDDDGLESGAEPTLAPDGRVVLRDLVEEEILLAAPLVPRHEDVAECGPGDAIRGEPEAPEDAKKGPMNTPFAGLGELLKRGH
jgi:uncharacterized protein